MAAKNEILELSKLLDFMDDEDAGELDNLLNKELPPWVPLPGPQLMAYECEADILYYGGSAGGGKTDLLLGLASTQHIKSIIFRREAVQLQGVIDRLTEIRGGRQGFSEQKLIWRLPGRQIEFGHCKDEKDKEKYQGRPHDLVGFDEITHFLESQFRFLIGWNRSTIKGQRCRIVATGNPPTSQEGRWVVSFWAAWLDPNHPNPAKPGELRWYTTIDGKDIEQPNGDPVEINGKMVKPLSRTFIPSKLNDNPFLMVTGYEATLQALPEPLRSQMLEGNFWAGVEDNAFQVIPSTWVDQAMARWTDEGNRGYPMDSVGVDVARGGSDQTIISCRYDNWFDKLRCYPGASTPDGPTVAGLAVSCVKDRAPIHVDVIGVGGSVVDTLRGNDVHVIAVNGAEAAPEGSFDQASKKLTFRNMRALIWWRMREALDPKTGLNLKLPLDQELKSDLCTPLWKLTIGGILIEDKEEIRKRLGRSPDKGDAVVMANIRTTKRIGSEKLKARRARGSWVTA